MWIEHWPPVLVVSMAIDPNSKYSLISDPGKCVLVTVCIPGIHQLKGSLLAWVFVGALRTISKLLPDPFG
jgi:hypothetical protein